MHLTLDSIVIETPDSTEKERVYPLTDSKAREIFNKSEGIGFSFEVDLIPKKKVLIFKCLTSEDRADWVSTINLLKRPLLMLRPYACGLSSQVLNILYEDGFV